MIWDRVDVPRMRPTVTPVADRTNPARAPACGRRNVRMVPTATRPVFCRSTCRAQTLVYFLSSTGWVSAICIHEEIFCDKRQPERLELDLIVSVQDDNLTVLAALRTRITLDLLVLKIE